jgi:hypothetical protein
MTSSGSGGVWALGGDTLASKDVLDVLVGRWVPLLQQAYFLCCTLFMVELV